MSEIASLVGSVGFPIAMCLIIMYYWNNQYTSTMEDLKETISQLTNVIVENTKTVALLEQYLRKENDDE